MLSPRLAVNPTRVTTKYRVTSQNTVLKLAHAALARFSRDYVVFLSFCEFCCFWSSACGRLIWMWEPGTWADCVLFPSMLEGAL